MGGITDTLERLIIEFKKLPGIGGKTAERLAYHILRTPESDALGLASAIRAVKEQIAPCPVCFHLSDGGLCSICAAPDRDTSVVLVVEQPKGRAVVRACGIVPGACIMSSRGAWPLWTAWMPKTCPWPPCEKRVAVGGRGGGDRGHESRYGRGRHGASRGPAAGTVFRPDHANCTGDPERKRDRVREQRDSERCAGGTARGERNGNELTGTG